MCVCVCVCVCVRACVRACVCVCMLTYQGIQVLSADQVDGAHINIGQRATTESITTKCVCCVAHKLFHSTNRVIHKRFNDLCWWHVKSVHIHTYTYVRGDCIVVLCQ